MNNKKHVAHHCNKNVWLYIPSLSTFHAQIDGELQKVPETKEVMIQ